MADSGDYSGDLKQKSGLEDDVARRRRQLEPILFHKHGVIIIKRDDFDLVGMDRILFDRLAKMRFGRGGTA